MIDKKEADRIVDFRGLPTASLGRYEECTVNQGAGCAGCRAFARYLRYLAYVAWTPDNPRPDDPGKCKCGATAADPYCFCGC